MKPLTKAEGVVMGLLRSSPGSTFTRTDIADALFGEGATTKSNIVDVHIKNIRAKIGKDAIVSVRGFGYKVLGEVAAN